MTLTQELNDGTYLRSPDGQLFVVHGGRRFHVADDPHVVESIGYPMNTVRDAGHDDLARIPEAADLTVGGTYGVIHFDTGNSNLGANHWMQTAGGISVDAGTLSGTTHTWTGTWLGGFHGAVTAILGDANGNAIKPTPETQPYLFRYGVDGSMIGNPSRYDPWFINFAKADLLRATQVMIAHSWDPDSLQADLDKAVKASGSISQIATNLASIAKIFTQLFAPPKPTAAA